ncbi:MAG: alkaline phosphatase [Deltaproteobacteria bacterium]|nr:MAG: alkaline phosphatase [Deltaproteobacteria bacterium]
MGVGTVKHNSAHTQRLHNLHSPGTNLSAPNPGPSSEEASHSAQKAAIQQQTQVHQYVVASSSTHLGGKPTQAKSGVRRTLGENRSSVTNTMRPHTVARSQPLPQTSPEATVTRVGKRTVIDAGDGNDSIHVSRANNGTINVAVNGENHSFTVQDAINGLTLRGGDGNDQIKVGDHLYFDLQIEGGQGNDKLQGGQGNDVLDGGAGHDVLNGGAGDDKLYGRDGKDTLHGQRGNDYLEGGLGDDTLHGGDGRDVLYGLDGNDTLRGGDGRDYLDGGRGNDNLRGDNGIDQLIGGRGQDHLQGGRGNDVLAGGHGKDRINGGQGQDTVYSQANDRVSLQANDHKVNVDLSDHSEQELGSHITAGPNRRQRRKHDPIVAAHPDFQMRVESDLDALRSIPAGREVLAAIDNNSGGHTVTIEQNEGRGNLKSTFNSHGYRNTDGTLGAGTSSEIGYDSSNVQSPGREAWRTRPPVVGLFHELIHSLDDAQGTTERGVTHEKSTGASGTPNPNAEHTTVGLSYDHDGDELDNHGKFNPHSNSRVHREGPSENKLRKAFNLERRTHY